MPAAAELCEHHISHLKSKRRTQQALQPDIPLDGFPHIIRQNAKPFEWTEAVMNEAFDMNRTLGSLWSESNIRNNWSLARSLVAARMRRDGATLNQIGKRLDVTIARVREVLRKLNYMAWRLTRKTNYANNC